MARQKRDFQGEWTHLIRLDQLGLSVPKPLFCGVDEAGGYGVVTRRLTDAVSVKEALLTRDRQEISLLLNRLFQNIAQQHEAGVLQRDNHLENYLWDSKNIYALDAASFQFKQRPLSLGQRVANLALLIANIDLPHASEEEAILQAYLDRASIKKKALYARLARAIFRQRRQRLRRYQKKTVRSCSAFIKTKTKDLLMLCNRKLPTEVQQALVHEPDRLVEMGSLLKDGNTCTVATIKLNHRDYVLKRYQPKPLIYRLRHVLLGSRAKRSWTQMHTARLFGLRAPLAEAYLEERQGQLVYRAFLLMDKVPGIPMDQWIHEHRDDLKSLQELSQRFAVLWKALGVLRANHGDMKATNLLVDANGDIVPIDFDQVHFFLPPGIYHRLRNKDWRRFMQNWQMDPEVAALFRASVDKAVPPA